MIYNFLLKLLPITPVLAILAAVGLFIFSKNHMKDDGRKTSSGSHSGDEWEPYNRFASNNDPNDYLNGPYGPH